MKQKLLEGLQEDTRPLRFEMQQPRCLGAFERRMHFGHREPRGFRELRVGRAPVTPRGQHQQQVQILRLENGLAVAGRAMVSYSFVFRETVIVLNQSLVNDPGAGQGRLAQPKTRADLILG